MEKTDKTNCLIVIYHQTLLTDLGYQPTEKRGDYFVHENRSMPYNKFRRVHVHEHIRNGTKAMLFLQTSRDKQDDYILMRPLSTEGFFEGGADKLNVLGTATKQKIVNKLKQFALV